MKRIIVDIKKDKDKVYSVSVTEKFLPAFQKMIVNGCDDETIIDFKFDDKALEEVEIIDNKDVQK